MLSYQECKETSPWGIGTQLRSMAPKISRAAGLLLFARPRLLRTRSLISHSECLNVRILTTLIYIYACIHDFVQAEDGRVRVPSMAFSSRLPDFLAFTGFLMETSHTDFQRLLKYSNLVLGHVRITNIKSKCK